MPRVANVAGDKAELPAVSKPCNMSSKRERHPTSTYRDARRIPASEGEAAAEFAKSRKIKANEREKTEPVEIAQAPAVAVTASQTGTETRVIGSVRIRREYNCQIRSRFKAQQHRKGSRFKIRKRVCLAC
jgi:hypothetical protein